MLISNDYYPLINVPTRVTDNFTTIIDHIITNDHSHNISSGVIKTDLTDHFPIFCSISNVTLKKSHKPIFRRDFSMLNEDDFCNHLNTEINSFFLTISYIHGNNFDDIFDQFLQLPYLLDCKPRLIKFFFPSCLRLINSRAVYIFFA